MKRDDIDGRSPGSRPHQGAGSKFVDDPLDGDKRALRRKQRLLLHAGETPQLDVAGPGRGFLSVNDRDIGTQRGTAASSSPLNGQVIVATWCAPRGRVPW